MNMNVVGFDMFYLVRSTFCLVTDRRQEAWRWCFGVEMRLTDYYSYYFPKPGT